MCHTLPAFTDTGNLVLHHEAPGREIGGHTWGLVAAEIEHRTRTKQVQTRRVVVPDRTGRVCFIGPVAVRVEVLRSVQRPPESFYGRALGAILFDFAGIALRVEVHLAWDHLALVVEQTLGADHCSSELTSQMVHAGHQRRGGLLAGTRISVG